MYTLTLTRDERKAFDWVGGRYATGGEVSNLLCECKADIEQEWGDSADMTFYVPEHIAWKISDLSESEDHLWPCFSPTLASKMESFVSMIV